MLDHIVLRLKTYGIRVRKFEGVLLKKDKTLDKTLDEILNDKIDPYNLMKDFVVYLDKSGLKPRTIHIRINAVKSYLRDSEVKIYTEDFKQAIKL